MYIYKQKVEAIWMIIEECLNIYGASYMKHSEAIKNNVDTNIDLKICA